MAHDRHGHRYGQQLADKPVIKYNEVIERSARIDDARFESRERIGLWAFSPCRCVSVTVQLAVRSLDVNLLDLVRGKCRQQLAGSCI